jgi:DNA-binding beta-propeller fold protein YncE
MKIRFGLLAAIVGLSVCGALADDAGGPYKLLKTVTVGGEGRWDYITVDAEARRIYVPRNNRVTVFDADSLKKVGEIPIPGASGLHGVALAGQLGRGFTSNGNAHSVTIFDLKTLATLQTVAVDGSPDNILFDPATQRVLAFSHAAPNVTVISASDGSVVGTIDLGGEPEAPVTDGKGHVYVNIEDTSEIAVIDPSALKVTARWKLGEGEGPSGLAFDGENHRLFSCCHNQKMVILDADSGAMLATDPIGSGVDAATFNPDTHEAFSSNGDGTLTVVKEENPNNFEVEQNVQTRAGARTCALDAKTNQIVLVTAQFGAASTAPSASGRRQRPPVLPDTFMILVVGR